MQNSHQAGKYILQCVIHFANVTLQYNGIVLTEEEQEQDEQETTFLYQPSGTRTKQYDLFVLSCKNNAQLKSPHKVAKGGRNQNANA